MQRSYYLSQPPQQPFSWSLNDWKQASSGWNTQARIRKPQTHPSLSASGVPPSWPGSSRVSRSRAGTPPPESWAQMEPVHSSAPVPRLKPGYSGPNGKGSKVRLASDYDKINLAKYTVAAGYRPCTPMSTQERQHFRPSSSPQQLTVPEHKPSRKPVATKHPPAILSARVFQVTPDEVLVGNKVSRLLQTAAWEHQAAETMLTMCRFKEAAEHLDKGNQMQRTAHQLTTRLP